jgi:hypothetical protein
MINSAIFEAYSISMSQITKNILFIFMLGSSIAALSQYTETINSNRPGASQGAFSVGRQVVQGETGIDFGNDTHSLLNTDTDIFGFNLGLRYGLLIETLELNANIRYQVNNVSFTSGNANGETLNGLENMQLGAKYLVYDPYKYENDEPNLYSYHANHRFKWRSLIPAVSVYASAIFDYTNNPFLPVIEDGVSPNIALITQHNWGRWVWVNNLIADRISTDFPSYIWITTMTHSFNPKISGFAEFQLIDGDLYADYLARLGGAYLITKDFQVDVSGLINFKDTPSRWNIGFGLSYRLDFHDKDQKLEIKDTSKGSAKRQSDKINKKNKRNRKDAVDPDGDDGGAN